VEIRQVVACVFPEALLYCLQHGFIFCYHDAVHYGEIFSRVIVDDWSRVRITDHSHHRLNKCFPCAKIPILKTRNEVNIQIGLLVQHVDRLVACAGHARDVFGLQRVENSIHALLIFVHRTADPKVVMVFYDAVFRRKRWQRRELRQSLHLSWEYVLDEDSALWGAEISPSLSKRLLVKKFMNDSDARSTFYADTDHARDVVQVPLSEALCSVERIYPYYHVVFIELIRKLHLSLRILGRLHTVDAFHVL